VQLAIASLVPFASIIVQTLKQRCELVKVLESGDVGFFEFPLVVRGRGRNGDRSSSNNWTCPRFPFQST
jgi:hypothetical protein